MKEQYSISVKQYETLEFIINYFKYNHYAPTTAEIASGIGIKSRGVVYRYLKVLEKENLLTLIPGKRRNIQLKELAIKHDGKIAIVGKIAAGHPIEVINNQNQLDVTHWVKDRYLLQVVGDSMQGDLINDGDYIVCERRETLSEDEICVVVIDSQESALKRIVANDDGSVTLISSNPDYPPQKYSQERVQIQGVYIGLIRINQQ
jgi:repressor LexA